MRSQAEKASAFRALHEREGAFLIPNPWDAGTARLLAGLGFEALATTSAGYAFSLGRRDNTIDRDTMMAHAGVIVAATDLPVSADLENGFGDDPALLSCGRGTGGRASFELGQRDPGMRHPAGCARAHGGALRLSGYRSGLGSPRRSTTRQGERNPCAISTAPTR